MCRGQQSCIQHARVRPHNLDYLHTAVCRVDLDSKCTIENHANLVLERVR